MENSFKGKSLMDPSKFVKNKVELSFSKIKCYKSVCHFLVLKGAQMDFSVILYYILI